MVCFLTTIKFCANVMVLTSLYRSGSGDFPFVNSRLMAWAMSHAGVLFRRTSGPRSVQCQALAGSGNNASAGCPALKACLIEAMASGAVWYSGPPTHPWLC